MVEAVTLPITDTTALAPGEAMPAEATPQADLVPTTAAPTPAGAAPEGTPEKFLNADGTVNTAALVESYKNLETKVGEDKPAEATPEATGPVTYGTAIDGALGQAGLTPDGVNKEWQDTGTLTDATMNKLEAAGFSKDVVKQYIEGAAAKVQASEQGAALAQHEQNAIMDTVGGKDAYQSMTSWAKANLSESEIAAYDGAVSGGNRAMLDIAVAGLQAKYQQAEGSTGKLALGGVGGGPTDVFESVQEMSGAMSAARKTRDPAKIQAVEAKALRSDI